jgi:hypothetical protein
VLFRLDVSCFTEGARCLIQLVLRSDSIDNAATGGSDNQDGKTNTPRKNKRDPELSEFHLYVTPI